MTKKDYEKIINKILKYELDFIEIFHQKGSTKLFTFEDKKLGDIKYYDFNGIGIRTLLKDKEAYAHTNILNVDSIEKLIEELTANEKLLPNNKKIYLKKEKLESYIPIISHKKFSDSKKKRIMREMDLYIRTLDKRITQVQISFLEKDYKVTISNSKRKYISENRCYTRIFITVVAKEEEKTANSYDSYAINGGYEIFNKLDIKKISRELVKSVIKKLNPISIEGGEMPVVLESGFGAVIFHEACGHAMEATTVSKGTSILTGKLGEKIASEKVTIIDDATLNGHWGSTKIDDEGNATKKNILIENGILKNYLIHGVGAIRMNMPATGSSRRESYEFMPTSRMNNTYLKPLNDNVKDMIKSIKYGIYAKQMGGGSVDPITGDFNFATNEAYLIENGKIGPIIKSATLIGNTLDILKNVEMVSDNLEFSPGMCGSESGNVPVCIGQPTIKISKILVGGDK